MSAPGILSVSRRTDVPAFYAEWFINRLRAGRAEYVHPFNQRRIEVEISPGLFAVIVFWTKDFSPLLSRLDQIEDLGFPRYVVHYTITGLGENWEPGAPEADKAVHALAALSHRIGPGRVFWRFDPMPFTDRLGVAEHLERFASLGSQLEGLVRRCHVSVVQPYAKIRRRLEEYEKRTGERVREPGPDELIELSRGLAEIGRGHDMTVFSCCTEGLAGFGVQPSSCLSGSYLLDLWPDCGLQPEPGPTRKGCHCDRVVDLGAYDTCPHRCRYCYANSRDSLIDRRFAAHRPGSPSLVPLEGESVPSGTASPFLNKDGPDEEDKT